MRAPPDPDSRKRDGVLSPEDWRATVKIATAPGIRPSPGRGTRLARPPGPMTLRQRTAVQAAFVFLGFAIAEGLLLIQLLSWASTP
jgi:hypothetical protein